MFSLIKVLKVGLPVTTVASATAITAFLVSFKKEDVKLNKENDDKVLEDFEKPIEIYEEEVITYPKEEKEDIKSDSSESRKKLEDKVNKELGKQNRKNLVQKLLNDAESLVDELLKSNEITATRDEIKEVLKEASLKQNLVNSLEKITSPNQENSLERGEDNGVLADQDREIIRSSGEEGKDIEGGTSIEISESEKLILKEGADLKEEEIAKEAQTVENLNPTQAAQTESAIAEIEEVTGDGSPKELNRVTETALTREEDRESFHEASSENKENEIEVGNSITLEQLQRMTEIADEASNALNSLESLLEKI